MMRGFCEAACSGGSACLEHESKAVLAARRASRDRVAKTQISLHIHGRARRPLLLSDSRVPGFRR